MFNYNKLRGRIKEIFGTNQNFADAIGMGRGTLSAKLNNLTEFTQSEMRDSAKLLCFPESDIPVYFFTVDVRETE